MPDKSLANLEKWASGIEVLTWAHQPILAHADREVLPCYLETTKDVNVPFYEKHGFTVVSDGIVPDTALRVWGMRRK